MQAQIVKKKDGERAKSVHIFLTKPSVAIRSGERPIPCRMVDATMRPVEGFDSVFETIETTPPTMRTVGMLSALAFRIEVGLTH